MGVSSVHTRGFTGSIPVGLHIITTLYLLNLNYILTFLVVMNISYFTGILYFLVNTTFVGTNSQQKSISFCTLLYTFVHFIVLNLIFVVIWKSSPLVCWYSHFMVTGLQFKFFYFFILTLLLTFLVIFNRKSVQVFDVDGFLILLLLTVWVFCFFTVTNIITFFFCIEVLTTTVLTLLVVFFSFQVSRSSKVNTLRELVLGEGDNLLNFFSLIFFFWVSVITSVLIFLFLTYFSSFFFLSDWYLINFFIYFVLSTHSLKILSLLFASVFVFFILIFFKLGLPPFFFWKLFFFIHSSFVFIYLYITTFYFFVFFVFLFFLHNWCTSLLLYFHNILFFLLLVSILMITCTFYTITKVKFFFVYSSLINSVFLLLILGFLVNNFNAFYFLNFIILYLVLYNWTLTLFAHILLNHNFVVFTTLSLLHYSSNVNYIKFILLLVFFSLTGLPPMSNFFTKLSLISYLFTSNFLILTTVIFIFLFVTLVFYFQNVKYLLINNDSVRKVNLTLLQPRRTGFSFNICTILTILLVFGFFLFDSLLLFCNWMML